MRSEKEIDKYIFDKLKPEKYPFGYSIKKHKIRTGMYYEEFIPNLPPEGKWNRLGPIPVWSNIITITRVKEMAK